MKRFLFGLLALVIIVLGGRAIVRSLASDETKIERLVESMIAGYNAGDVGDTLRPLAKDWSHEGLSWGRQDLRQGLIAEFFQDRDPKTKKLMRRADWDPESLVIEVTGDTATFELDATLSRSRGGAWEVKWRIHLTAELELGSNGWFIQRTRHDDLEGTLLSR